MNNLEKLIQEFLVYCEVEKNKSPKTIINYEHYLNRFARWTDESNISKPSDITLKKVQSYRLYLNHLDGYNLKRKTQNYHVIALRAFLKYLTRQDIQTLAPEKIELGKNEDREINFLDEEELDRLLAAPDVQTINGMRDKAILETLFSTGLRVSELVSLDKDKINLKRQEFSVTGKGRKTRIVFLSSAAKEAIDKYFKARHDDSRAVFVNHSKNYNHQQIQDDISLNNSKNKKDLDIGRLTPRSIQRIIQKYALQASIAKKVTPHVLRHTFGTDLLRSGADIRAVQQLLGHSSITTTQIYTHVTDKHLRDVHHAFHARRKR